jgi:hypothetical protein
MAHIIQLAFGAFLNRLGITGHMMSWKAHEYDQQFGENISTDIGKYQ